MPRSPNGESPRSKPSSEAGPRKKKRRRVRLPLIKVQESATDVTVKEWIRREGRSGGLGLLVSSGLHILILLLLAWMVVHRDSDEIGGILQFGWLPPTRDLKKDAAPAPIKFSRPLSENSNAKNKKDPNPNTLPNENINRGVDVKPVDVKKLLEARTAKTRVGSITKNGINNSTKQAISTGLAWLKRQQLKNGSWKLDGNFPDNLSYVNLRTDTGATALALLAYLGDGQTHREGDYQATVAGGLDWLKKVQQSDGNLFDILQYGRTPTYYAHSMATIALCEAYAMTGDRTLRIPALNAVKFLIASQHVTNGGWKYSKLTGVDLNLKGDLSVTGWALMALHAARLCDFDVSDDVWIRASTFLDSVQVQGGAQYKYEPTDPDNAVSVAMTAEGILCRQWIGWPRDHAPMLTGVRFIQRAEHRPDWSNGRRNIYFWYYATQVMHNLGGQEWKDWYERVNHEIVSHRVKVGSSKKGKDVRGSWHPSNPPGSPHDYSAQVGRLYTTAMCILILETPFRHVPVYPAPVDEP